MSKQKRGFEAPNTGTGGTPSSPVTPGSRAAARRSSAPVRVSPEPQSFLEKYRFMLIIGLVVLGIGALGFVFLQQATAAPYACTTLMTPGPVQPIPTPRSLLAVTPAPSASVTPTTSTDPAASATPAPTVVPTPTPDLAASPTPAPTPVPQPTQQLGFPTQDLGRDHKGSSTSITYAYCPPASGPHYADNRSPLGRGVYGPNDKVLPANWVHSLEHGYVAILYKGEPDEATMAALERIVDEAKGTAFTVEQCRAVNKVLVARFDDMTTPFAAVSWDRALLLDEFDAEQLQTFAEQWQESPVWPEQGVC